MIRQLSAIPPLLATTVRGLLQHLVDHVSLHSRLPVSLADIRRVYNRGRSRQCTCLGPHVSLHDVTRILSPPQLRGRQITWSQCYQGSKHGISTFTLWGGGARVAQPLLPSSATAAFSRLAGRRGRGGTRRLRFRLGLAVPQGLAFVWAFCCPVAILTAVEALFAVGV